MTVRAIVADRNRLVREVVTRGLQARDISVVAAVSGARELAAAVREGRPDVVLLSDSLRGAADGFISGLVDAGVHVIVLGEDPCEDHIVACLDQGASGYVTHEAMLDVIADAVLSVARGQAALHGRAAHLVLAQWRGFRSTGIRNGVSLTPRETEVLSAMVEGLPAKVIAQRLGVRLKTIESHKVRLFDKLGAHSQAHAVSIAIAHGLVVPARSTAEAGGSAHRPA